MSKCGPLPERADAPPEAPICRPVAAKELAESTEEVSREDKLQAAGTAGGGAKAGDVLARLKAKRGG